MIVFAREVFVCKCSTDVGTEPPPDGPSGKAEMRFVKGTEAELSLLDPAHQGETEIADMRARLARGEHWMVGLSGGRIVTYTWLHARDRCDYPYLPGCSFHLAPDTAYGYDAWTPPDLRGGGLRRRAFLEELRILKGWGKAWEVSYFVKHQLEGATRSLGTVGIKVHPLWRVVLERSGGAQKLRAEKLVEDACTWPAF
jgi:hypothetical protein